MSAVTLESAATVQSKMRAALIDFITQNLADRGVISWPEAWEAHLAIRERYAMRTDTVAWLGGRVDADAQRSLGVRLSRRIECEGCGRCFGHKTWHSGTPNRADVWECPTNHAKRGTCRTSHIYESVLSSCLANAFQTLANRDKQLIDEAAICISSVTALDSEEMKVAIGDILASSQAVLHLPDFLSIFEGACVLTDHRLGFVFTTGDAVTLELPAGWTPTRH